MKYIITQSSNTSNKYNHEIHGLNNIYVNETRKHKSRRSNVMSAAAVTSKNISRCQWWRGRAGGNSLRMSTRQTLIIDKIKSI
jgi:hypothetical protein